MKKVSISKNKLIELYNEFIEIQCESKEEWYCSDKELAENVLNQFFVFIGIQKKQENK